MPTLPASWSLTPTPQFRTVWPGPRKDLVVGTLCSTANLPANPSSATMSWEMNCLQELHTIPWLTLDHAHVFSHTLLGADGVPPHKLNPTRRPLVIIQACLVLGQPVLLGSPVSVRLHGEPTCHGCRAQLSWQDSLIRTDRSTGRAPRRLSKLHRQSRSKVCLLSS